MRPHPRIRKTVKWGGAVACAILVVLWLASGWAWLNLGNGGGFRLQVGEGRAHLSGTHWLALGDITPKPAPRATLVDFVVPLGRIHMARSGSAPSFRWDSEWNGGTAAYGHWCASLPLWMLLLTCSIVAAIAWRLDTLARRRANIGLCPKCSYSRTGLAPDAVCPECGTPALSPPPSAS